MWGATLVLMVALVLAAGPAAAQATWTDCTGTETLVGLLDPGVWTQPGHNIHVRGMVSQFDEDSSCPQLDGLNTTTMNANWDAHYAGPMWGTSYHETSYGTWEGTWQGTMNPDGSYSYEAVSHGVTGTVAGMHLRVSASASGIPGEPTVVTATILDPQGG
jgi:hypothetical protein